MLGSSMTKNVIEATNRPGLFEKLEDLQKRLMFFSLSLTALNVVHVFLSLLILSLITGLHCAKKLLPNTWRQKDLPSPDFTLYHLQTCWISWLKAIAQKK